MPPHAGTTMLQRGGVPHSILRRMKMTTFRRVLRSFLFIHGLFFLALPFPLAGDALVFSTADAPPYVTDTGEGFGALENRRVAYIDGWKVFEEMVRGTAYTFRATDEAQLFQALLSGRVELILYNAARGNAWIKRNPTRKIYRVPGTLTRREMYLYLHESREELIPDVSEALDRIRESSWYAELEQESLGREG